MIPSGPVGAYSVTRINIKKSHIEGFEGNGIIIV